MPWWWPFGQGASGANGRAGEMPPPVPRPPPPPEPPPPVWQGGEILVSPSRKLHPEIDYEALAQGYIASGLDLQVGSGRSDPGEVVTSPYDLFEIETARDRYGMRTGRVVPTDVFVLGKGR